MNASPDPYDFGEPVYKYTRAQAIEDGMLADLSACHSVEVERAGIVINAAMTATAYAAIVWPLDEPAAAPAGTIAPGDVATRGKALNDAGEVASDRVARLLAAYRHTLTVRRARIQGDRFTFAVTVLHAPGDWREIDLIAHVGGGDNGEPVLTFMLDGES